MDNFTIFYFQYMKGNKYNDSHFWTNNIGSALHRTWCGLAFEHVCLQHIERPKKALGISRVLTNVIQLANRSRCRQRHREVADRFAYRPERQCYQSVRDEILGAGISDDGAGSNKTSTLQRELHLSD